MRNIVCFAIILNILVQISSLVASVDILYLSQIIKTIQPDEKTNDKEMK